MYPDLETADPALSQSLERRILERTCGRVSSLCVDVQDNAIIVRGATPTYYLKQLVLQAVLESLPNSTKRPVTLEIEVGAIPSRH